MDRLDTTIARGFRVAAGVADDRDLAALHPDPRWQLLLTRLQEHRPR